jgi:hypothetical protein
MVVLSGTACSAWRLLDGAATAEDLAGRLVRRFSARPEIACADVTRVLRVLRDGGWIEQIQDEDI